VNSGNSAKVKSSDNKFRLRRLLGGTDDSAVFLTQLAYAAI